MNPFIEITKEEYDISVRQRTSTNYSYQNTILPLLFKKYVSKTESYTKNKYYDAFNQYEPELTRLFSELISNTQTRRVLFEKHISGDKERKKQEKEFSDYLRRQTISKET